MNSSFTIPSRMSAQDICRLSQPRAMCQKCAQRHMEIPAATFLTARPRLPFSESLYVVALEDGLYQWRSADVVDVTLH